MFLPDGNGRIIFSAGQHAVEALIRGATWVLGKGGRVPVAPVSTGGVGLAARNHGAATARHTHLPQKRQDVRAHEQF